MKLPILLGLLLIVLLPAASAYYAPGYGAQYDGFNYYSGTAYRFGYDSGYYRPYTYNYGYNPYNYYRSGQYAQDVWPAQWTGYPSSYELRNQQFYQNSYRGSYNYGSYGYSNYGYNSYRPYYSPTTYSQYIPYWKYPQYGR